MLRDSFYRKIIERLSDQLDPELFERAACDLLRAAYPALVPIRGGNDAGMDGAIADGKKPAFPLICTTGRDVRGNLRRSVESYKKNSGRGDRIVLATSQQLSPSRKRGLEKLAQTFGFTLVQIHDQADFADRLYRAPQWCRELLGLVGNPPGLSTLPYSSSTRPVYDQQATGREKELNWLRNTPGDLLLAGQPGLGKTFLFQVLVKEGKGLFVSTSDLTQITEGIREFQPEILFVDDAHLKLEVITNLYQLREELGASFRVVANCWPNYKDDIVRSLRLSATSVTELKLLTRDQIVEVIKATGIKGPVGLMRELTNQANGRPGLAVTLCWLCRKGDIHSVVSGQALFRDLRPLLRSIGEKAATILGCFAVGGKAGMRMNIIAERLGVALLDVQYPMTHLSAAGIVSDVGENRLCVNPAALRHSLVHEAFYKGAASVPIQQFLSAVPDHDETALTLISACARGANIPDTLLQQMVRCAINDDVWKSYAGLGSRQSEWILENHPEKLQVVAHVALDACPEKTISLLLTAAVVDRRPTHSYPDQPIRILEDWIKEAWPNKGAVVSRRERLFNSTLEWHSSGGNTNITLQSLAASLFPGFQSTDSDPGSGHTITVTTGGLKVEEIQSIEKLWMRLVEFLKSIEVHTWAPVQEIVHDWINGPTLGKGETDEAYKERRSFAMRMLKDLIAIGADRPGLTQWIRRTTSHLNVSTQVSYNPEFDAIYPIERLAKDREKVASRQKNAAVVLAKQWSLENPATVASRLLFIEAEARSAGLRWPRLADVVSREIAQLVENPIVWAESFKAARLTSDLVFPFVDRALAIDQLHAIEFLESALVVQDYYTASALAILAMESPPNSLLEKALKRLNGLATTIECMVLRQEISEATMQKLFEHQDPAIAAAAAIGEWDCEPRGKVRPSIAYAWRKAIIEHVNDGDTLSEIFKYDSTIAYGWTQRRIRSEPNTFWRSETEFIAAVGSLSHIQRQTLLQELSAESATSRTIQLLVGDDVELYCDLLGNDQMQRHHLVPLTEEITEAWIMKARAALDHTYSVEDIANRLLRYLERTGDEPDMWAAKMQEVDLLKEHMDTRVQEIGRIAAVQAERLMMGAQERERRNQIYGD